MTQFNALVFLGSQLLLGLAILTQLNTYSIILGACSLPFVVIYPFMKRITYHPQIVFGEYWADPFHAVATRLQRRPSFATSRLPPHHSFRSSAISSTPSSLPSPSSSLPPHLRHSLPVLSLGGTHPQHCRHQTHSRHLLPTVIALSTHIACPSSWSPLAAVHNIDHADSQALHSTGVPC